MASSERSQENLRIARRVLDFLEEQAAGYTALTIPASLKIDLEEKRREVAELEARLQPMVSTTTRRLPYHNLPRPDYTRFVGREMELTWLRQRLSPRDRAWQIAITGIGGVGKSALALAIAHEYLESYDSLPATERYDAIIWISAKEEVLTAQGKEKAALSESVLRTLEDVYTAIAHALDREDITRALPEEQAYVVEKALKEQRTLLIMDNLESVKDERIQPFLRNLPAPTKAIITSREWLDVADVFALKGLPIDEADVLISDEADIRQITLNVDQRQKIYDLTSGLPLPIKLGVARLSSGESFAAVERWLGDAVGDLPDYCISGQVELAKQSNLNTWTLLLACSLFDRSAGVSREALGHVADLSLVDLDIGLAQLQRLFLINHTDKGRFWVLPIVQRYASIQFNQNESSEIIVQRWLGWLASFVSQNSDELEWQIEQIADFGIEFPNILAGIRWCRDQKCWEILSKLCENTWNYTYVIGLFHELDEILEAANQAAVELKEERLQARILLQKVRLDEIRSKPLEFILESLDIAEKAAIRFGNLADLGEAWATRISTYRFMAKKEETAKNLLAADKWAYLMLEEAEKRGDLHLKYLAAIRLSEIKTDENELLEATQWVEVAEQCVKDLKATRMVASVISRRGTILRKQQNYKDAEKYFMQALEMYSKWGLKRHIAATRLRLARVYKDTKRIQLAIQYAEEAKDIYTRIGLGSSRSVEKIDALLSEIHQGLADSV